MKIYNFVLGAALLAALTACSPVASKEDKNDSTATESKAEAKPVVTAPVATDGKVIELDDASLDRKSVV